jgi:transmembrane sensor
MDFENYSVKDFVLNESFQKWILEHDEDARIFWEDCLSAHPAKADLMREAQSVILSIKGGNDKHLTREREQVWRMILESIHQTDRDPASKIREINQSK